MTTRATPLNQLKPYTRALRDYRWLWIVPTVAFTLLAGMYALTKSSTWKASQAISVRDESAGGFSRQGRFDSSDALKLFQEEILEVARDRTAVAAALKSLGAPAGAKPDSWPTQSDVEELQDAITVSAPRGGEFGTTEMIYLHVTGRNKQQAIDRTDAVYTQLEAKLGDRRVAKAKSLVRETRGKLRLAQESLDESIARLAVMEREVGSDLGELRILNDSGSGDSNLRSALNQIKIELRQATAELEAGEHQESMLVAANDDPENLLATSSRLFDAQPALRQLKEGLLNAQLRSAELAGKMTEAHPLVISARDTEKQVRQDFHRELAASLRGVRSDLEVNRQRVASLQQQHDSTSTRLAKLAELRASYGNLVADVRQHTALVEKAQEELAAARASVAGAETASLIARFDTPVVGSSPVGPGRSTIVAAGFAGGLFVGLGLVLLAMPSASGQGRRWSDFLRSGRRADGRQGGRRAEDNAQVASAGAASRRASDAAPRNRRGEDQRQQRSTQPRTLDPEPTDAAEPQPTPQPVEPSLEPVEPQAAEPAEVAVAPQPTLPVTVPSSESADSIDHEPKPTATVDSPPEQIPTKPRSSSRSLLAACLSELESSS